MQGCSSDVLRSVNGTASKCPFLATATEKCCPARGTLAGHFTRRLSPSPMPGRRIQERRAYLPLKKKQSAPAILSLEGGEAGEGFPCRASSTLSRRWPQKSFP